MAYHHSSVLVLHVEVATVVERVLFETFAEKIIINYYYKRFIKTTDNQYRQITEDSDPYMLILIAL